MTDTDELIETLERLEKEATPRPWKLFHDEYAPAVDYIERDMGDDRRAQGLEDPILHACLPREGDLPLIVSLRNHLPALISALKESRGALPWKLFYGDGLDLKQIAKRLGCSVYDLSPWLTAPLTRCDGHPFQTALNAAHEENKRLREALEPFAAACAKADLHADEVKRAGMGTVSDSATPGWGIRYGHLKAARAALQPQGEK